MDPQSRRRRAAVLVTVLSIALAEVSIGSAPLGLLLPVQWVLLVPVYGAQVLLVGKVVTRRHRAPTLAAVWSAGVVMGLYEFYITRVLWDSPWDGTTNRLLVEPLALAVVAGFYHPFVSVMLPLALTERVMTGRSTLWELLPRWLRGPRPPLGLGLISLAGFVAGGLNRPAGPLVLATVPLSGVLVWLTVRWARGAGRAASLADILPRARGTRVAAALVAAVFAPFVTLAQVGSDPVPWPRQAFAVACYAVFAWLAWRNLRHAPRPADAARPALAHPADATHPQLAGAGLTGERRVWRRAVAVFGASFLLGFAAPFGEVVGVAVVWGGGALAACAMMVAAAIGALSAPHREAARPHAADPAPTR